MKAKNHIHMQMEESGPLIMPAHVRTGQIMGLVDVTAELGNLTDLASLADELGDDIDTLLPIIDTAEMLGLVEVKKGVVSLTQLGSKFQHVYRNKLHLIKQQVAKIEPFKTAVDLSARGISSAEIARALSERGVVWHHEPELNEAEVHSLLIHWSIFAGLLKYDGKNGRFHRLRDQA